MTNPDREELTELANLIYGAMEGPDHSGHAIAITVLESDWLAGRDRVVRQQTLDDLVSWIDTIVGTTPEGFLLPEVAGWHRGWTDAMRAVKDSLTYLAARAVGVGEDKDRQPASMQRTVDFDDDDPADAVPTVFVKAPESGFDWVGEDK